MGEIIPGYGKSAEEILSSLTSREASVLKERFDINLEVNEEEKPTQKAAFLPPAGNNGGQGGAPQVAIAPASSMQDKEIISPDEKSPKHRKH